VIAMPDGFFTGMDFTARVAMSILQTVLLGASLIHAAPAPAAKSVPEPRSKWTR